MPINLLDLLNQLKKFITQEKGNIFLLLIYYIFGLAIFAWYYPLTTTWGIKTEPQFLFPLSNLIVIYSILTLLWLFTRRLGIKKNVVNIGIAQMDIINISTTNQLNAEQKMQISSEVSNYIYNRLNHEKNTIKIINAINFVKLPNRIKIDYSNSDKIAETIGTDFIIWGTIRYNQEKIFLNYKFSTKKTLPSIFFEKLINDLNSYPEIEFSLSNSNNLEFNKFIHEIIYISIIFQSLELIQRLNYIDAEKILSYTLYKLNLLYNDKLDQSVNRGDKELSKVEVLIYFILAKVYFNIANSEIENFDYKNKANDMLEKSAKALDYVLSIQNKYIKERYFIDKQDKEKIELEYLQVLSNLGKTGNRKLAEKNLKNINNAVKDKYKLSLTKAIIEIRFRDFKEAKRHYEENIKINPYNVVVLRGLGLVEYELGNYKNSYNYLNKLEKITLHHIFQIDFYDTKVQKYLLLNSLKLLNLLGIIKHSLRFIIYSLHNSNIQKNVYIL